MKRQRSVTKAALFIMLVCAGISQAIINTSQTWEGVVSITDGDTFQYYDNNSFTWTLNNSADVTYSGPTDIDRGHCVLGYLYNGAVTSVLTIQTTVGDPGVINFIGNVFKEPDLGIRLGHTDDVGILNIENGNTLMVNAMNKYITTGSAVPSDRAIVNINDGHLFCYSSVADRSMTGITVNIAIGSSLRIMANIAAVYDAATYAVYTTGTDTVAGSVNGQPGTMLVFTDGGDYLGNPTVLITGQVGGPAVDSGTPADTIVGVGETAVFTVSATNPITGDTTDLDYSWYEYVDGGAGDILVGTNSPTLSLPGIDLSYDGKRYYCKVINAISFTDSRQAYLTVKRKVAHWQFEDNMVDIVAGWTGEFVDPNELHPVPTPVYDPAGIDGKAFQFAGDTTQIRVTNSNDGSFDFYPNGLTVNCWLKTTEPQADPIGYPVLYGNPSDVGGDLDARGWYVYAKPDNTCGGKVQGAGSIETPPLVGDGQWHMLTLTHAGGVVTVYADGALVDSLTNATPVYSMNESLLIMGAMLTGERSFKGSLDDVRIYNYPLSAVQVATLYTNFVPSATICAAPVTNDFNGDCIVNLADFAIFAASWLDCNQVPTCTSSDPQ